MVLKALNEKNIFLIQGPPGAGKTTVIKEIVF
ncbi:AAA domain-containing protein [Helicobacter pylori]